MYNMVTRREWPNVSDKWKVVRSWKGPEESATFSGLLAMGNCLRMRRDIEGTFPKMVIVQSIMERMKTLSMCYGIVLQLSMFGTTWYLEIFLISSL